MPVGTSEGRSNVPAVRLRKPSPPLIDPSVPPRRERSEFDAEELEGSTPPPQEAIEWHLSYLAEAYLPSHAEGLADALTRLGWSTERWRPAPDLVPSMREGSLGGAWSSLKTLLPEGTMAFFGQSTSARLPDGVSSIRLRLWSVTPSLTVLVAVCEWDEYSGDALDRLLRTDYETAWIPLRNGGHQVYGPVNLKELELKRRRQEMHRRVASWLTERVPGAFEDLGVPHPAVDVVSTALARPFEDEDRFVLYDYRRILSLDRRFTTGTSPSLPGWRLALPEQGEPPVLTLAGRTADVFDDRVLDRYDGEVSRWALGNYMEHRVEDLVASWATLHLLGAMRASLASVRDRAPETQESPAQFTKRLSGDVPTVLRRGADAGAFCADVRRYPAELGPLMVLRSLDFTMTYGMQERAEPLRTWWSRRVKDESARVAELEHDQRERLSTNVELAGLGQSVRTQNQMVFLTVALIIFAAATIALGVLQLDASHGTPAEPMPASRAAVQEGR
jgi:hypothetical protein